jgi:hypothetical protein
MNIYQTKMRKQKEGKRPKLRDVKEVEAIMH